MATSALFAAASRSREARPGAPRSGAARLIFLLTVLFLALFFALIAYSAWRDRERAMDDARRSATDLSKLLAEHVSRLIETTDLVLVQTQLLEQRLDWANPEEVGRFQMHLAESRAQLPYIGNVFVAGPDGAIRASAALTARSTVVGRAFFIAHRTSENALFIGDPDRDPDTGDFTFFLSRRQANADGSLRSVVAVSIRADYFSRLFHDL
ncbi:MAG: hypothetical protein JO021_10490, partial [Alphaproteobacteria bacterium]|nr:hypothetical protein [Alphaproteobacteria bacterium]